MNIAKNIEIFIVFDGHKNRQTLLNGKHHNSLIVAILHPEPTVRFLLIGSTY